MKKRLIFYISIGIAALFHFYLFYLGFIDPEQMLVPDSLDYLNYFSEIADWIGREKDVIRTPGYPIFTWILHWPFLITFVQVVLLGVNALLLYKLSQNHLDDYWAFLVVSLYLIDIPSIVNSHLILTETITTTMLLALIFLKDRREEWIKWTIGVLIAGLILTRPSMLFVVLLVLGFQILRRENWKIGILQSSLIGTLLLCTFMFSNYLTHGEFFISKIGHFNLAYYWAPEVMKDDVSIKYDFRTIQDHRDQLWTDVLKDVEEPNKNYLSYYNQLRSHAIDTLLANPISTMKIIGKNFFRTFMKADAGYLSRVLKLKWEGDSISEKWTNATWNLKALIGYQLLLNLLVGIGFFLAIGFSVYLRKWDIVLMLGVAILVLLMNPGYATDARFRIPALPLLLLITVWMSAHLTSVFSKKKPNV